MAELNFGLLTPPGSQSIGNAFVQGMDQAAVARARENQNALSQYALSKARREDEQQNQLYRDIQDPNFKLDVRTALRYGPQGMAAFKAQQDAAAAALGTRVKQSTLDANAAKLPGEQADAFQKVLKPYSAAAYGSQTVAEGVASVKAMYANPTLAAVLTKIKPLEQAIADTTAAFGDPKTMTQWQAHWGGISPEKLLDAANARRPNPAKDLLIPDPDGKMVPNTALIAVKKELAGAGRAQAQPRPQQPAQAVIDPDNPGKTILVSREEAIRRGMTPANMFEKPMTQAQRVTYAKDKVSDKNVVAGALAVTGELEKLTDELVGNPDKNIAPALGLNSITGYNALTNPFALPKGDARKALQKLETFRGKIMALGRQLASQEGKLGNMAVQEWKFVSDAVQKLDPAAGNLDEQMRDVVRQAKEYARRQQTKYDETYADDLTAPPAGAGKKSSGASGSWGRAVAE
jgi:hypothetical protein